MVRLANVSMWGGSAIPQISAQLLQADELYVESGLAARCPLLLLRIVNPFPKPDIHAKGLRVFARSRFSQTNVGKTLG